MARLGETGHNRPSSMRGAFLHVVCGWLVSTSFAEPLRTVAEARALPTAAAEEGRPVHLSGVATYVRFIPSDYNFSLHDATGGVMIYPAERRAILPGQRVTVTGQTSVSVHGLRIVEATLELGEVGALPDPVRTTMAEVHEGRHEGRYAEMEGVLRAVRLEAPEVKPQRLALDFGGRSRRLTVWLSDYPGGPAQFQPGATFRIRGVVMRWRNPRGQTQNINVLTNAETDVLQIANPPPSEPLGIEAAQRWDGPDEPARSLGLKGVVTWTAPDRTSLILQEGSQAMRVRFAEGTTTLAQPGDSVDVRGFPDLGDYTLELDDAQEGDRIAGQAIAPEPYPDAAAVMRGTGLVDRDARLIVLPAKLIGLKEREDDRRVLEMASGGLSFAAVLPAESDLPDTVRAGSLLRLTGICDLVMSEERRRIAKPPDAFRLFLRDGSDVEVLRPGPWWTPGRLRFAAIAASLSLLLLAAWTNTLRRANRRLRQEVDARERAERELSNERRRVAAELHDTLEQTLTAASLQLNAATRTQSVKPPGAVNPLLLATQLIARSRQEVREAVWDLRLDQRAAIPLGPVIRQVCEESSAGSVQIKFVEEGEARPCPAHLAVQVIRLVREAIANALKHGAPQQVTVRFVHGPESLELTIEDDGMGFDPTAAPGPDSGHFGLSGMEERTHRSGGHFEVTSAPGQGCRIRIVIPLTETGK